MDPFVFALVVVMGGAVAAAARFRRGARHVEDAERVAAGRITAPMAESAVRVGDVLTCLDDEYWLSGELAVVREGTAAMRLFSAPEPGRERWVALPRDGRSVWVLYVDSELGSVGWPGVEAPATGRVLRRFEHGNAALVPSGDVANGWEGMGRFALFRTHDA